MADSGVSTLATELLATAQRVLLAEQRALALLHDSLDESILHAAACVAAGSGRILVSGMGKSGIAARKMAATFCSLDIPAQFLHAGDALHGDLGALRAEDVLIAVSVSGATRELLPIVHHARAIGSPTIGITATAYAPLARLCDHLLLIPLCDEGSGEVAAPMASTIASLAIGDMLAVLVAACRNNGRSQMRALHPAGDLGRRLRAVSQIMHGGDRIPLVGMQATGAEVLAEITVKGFGIAGVTDSAGRLVGTISDGDVRRHANEFRDCTAADVMVTHPISLPPEGDVGDALDLMRTHRVSALFVVDAGGAEVRGLVHIHDLLRLGVL